jgi:hypothetical protein
MVANITTILQRLTGEWAMLLQPEAILTVCGEIGYTAWRDRVLTPVTTMQLFLLQILHGPAGAFEQKVTVLNEGRFLTRTPWRERKECRARFWLV